MSMFVSNKIAKGMKIERNKMLFYHDLLIKTNSSTFHILYILHIH